MVTTHQVLASTTLFQRDLELFVHQVASARAVLSLIVLLELVARMNLHLPMKFLVKTNVTLDTIVSVVAIAGDLLIYHFTRVIFALRATTAQLAAQPQLLAMWDTTRMLTVFSHKTNAISARTVSTAKLQVCYTLACKTVLKANTVTSKLVRLHLPPIAISASTALLAVLNKSLALPVLTQTRQLSTNA